MFRKCQNKRSICIGEEEIVKEYLVLFLIKNITLMFRKKFIVNLRVAKWNVNCLIIMNK